MSSTSMVDVVGIAVRRYGWGSGRDSHKYLYCSLILYCHEVLVRPLVVPEMRWGGGG
jgi:hypothetical protein